jgi:regulator of protease activity HflC (stomatin/prohibitin superfamily)
MEENMLFLKFLMMAAGFGLFVMAAIMVALDLYRAEQYNRLLAQGRMEEVPPRKPIRWKVAAKLAALACLPLLLALSIVVVPSGMAGVRISQISGTRPGTLYPGVHFIKPLLERVALFDVRDRIFSTEAAKAPGQKGEILTVQAREGLNIGLAITVRYRLDPKRLDYIQNNLPQPVEQEIVPPVVASAFRELVPNYTVRDVFSAKREEVRTRAADIITQKLGADGIVVKEVMMRDVKLPEEYARGLEGLLVKEQENDRMGVETEIQQKQVKIAELEAEAAKVRIVKQAEGDAQVRVLQAKAESDAMQYTLPLKEKQIQQSRLEAEARKEATIQNAEAAAQAKVIDSKAELERRNLMADAEANRIRLTAAADAERLKSEAVVLKHNPLLINKIIAERLSDKVRIMMVPMDGKFFLTNDLLNGAATPAAADDSDSDSPPAGSSGQRSGSH